MKKGMSGLITSCILILLAFGVTYAQDYKGLVEVKNINIENNTENVIAKIVLLNKKMQRQEYSIKPGAKENKAIEGGFNLIPNSSRFTIHISPVSSDTNGCWGCGETIYFSKLDDNQPTRIKCESGRLEAGLKVKHKGDEISIELVE